MPAYTLSVILLAAMPIAERSNRLLLAVPAAILFAIGYSRAPKRGLQIMVFLTGLPLFLSLGGVDVGQAGTLFILAAYVVAFSRGRLRWRPVLVIPAVLLLSIYVVGTISLFGSVFFNSSGRLLVGLIAAAALGHMLYSHISEEGDAAAMVRAIGLVLLVEGAFVLLQRAGVGGRVPFLEAISPRGVIVGAVLNEGVERASGTVGDYELVAEWFAIGVPLFLAFAAGRRDRLFSAAVLVACAVGLVGTVTRGGLVAAAVGLTVLMLVAVWGGTRRSLAFVVAGVAAVSGAAAMAVLALPAGFAELVARLQQQSNTGSISSFQDLLVVSNRQFWLTLPPSILNPTALGHGYFRMDLLGLEPPASLHSLWLTLYYQSGVVGLAIAAFLLIVIIARAVPERPVARIDFHGYLLQAGLVGGFAAMMLSEVKVEFLRTEYTTQFALAYVGLMLGFNAFLSSKASADAAERRLAEEGVPEAGGPPGVAAVSPAMPVAPAPAPARRALDRAIQVSGAATGSVMLVDSESHMRIAAAVGLPAAVVARTEVRDTEGIAGWVLTHGKSMLVEDLPSPEDGTESRDRQPRSALSMPVMDDEGMLGVMNLTWNEPQAPVEPSLRQELEGIASDLAADLRRAIDDEPVPAPEGGA